MRSKRVAMMVCLLVTSSAFVHRASGTGSKDAARSAPAFGQLFFEPNVGQVDARARFVARAGGFTLFVVDHGAALALHSGPAGSTQSAMVSMRLVGANPTPRIEGAERLDSLSNYLIGDDASRWRSGVPNYARVVQHDVYPGIDLVFHARTGALEYDFVVAPGGHADAIEIAFEGADRIELTPSGSLVLHTAAGDLVQDAPKLFQTQDGIQRPVAGRFELRDEARVAFVVGDHDRTRPLVIDPTLVWSTFLGGAGLDFASEIVTDSQGFSWVAGTTYHASFPTTAGAYDRAYAGHNDLFVCKLNPGGNTLICSTYLGGSQFEYVSDLRTDGAGLPYVCGYTYSSDFPTSANAFDRTPGASPEGFVTKLNADASSIVVSTLLGGSGEDYPYSLAVVPSTGVCYVAGFTTSTNFPTTPAAFDTTHNGGYDLFVTELNSKLSGVVFSTYVGGSADDVYGSIGLIAGSVPCVLAETRSANFPTPTGTQGCSGLSDAVVFRLDATGHTLSHCRLVGGSGSESADKLVVDSQGFAYLSGWTASADFPTVNAYDTTLGGSLDLFVTKLNPSLTTISYSTYIGGSTYDLPHGFNVNSLGMACITGATDSTNFPTRRAIDTTHNGGFDAFVAMLTPAGNALQFSSFFGSPTGDTAGAVSFDGLGIMYVAGWAGTGFPTTAGSYDASFNGNACDGFVMKISGY